MKLQLIKTFRLLKYLFCLNWNYHSKEETQKTMTALKTVKE